MAVLRAYFDESERPDGTFVVAGFAYRRGNAICCLREWRKLFGPWGGCHMKELTVAQYGKGRFAGLDTTQTGQLLTDAISIINERASYAVAVSCNVAEMNRLLPKHVQGFEGAYQICCYVAMSALCKLVGDDEIAYVFESGHAQEKSANRYMSHIFGDPDLAKEFRHFSHSFVSKNRHWLLQTADVNRPGNRGGWLV